MPHEGRSQNNIETDTIPFLLTPHNNISIQTILNKKDTLHLMFHTGESSVTLTEAAANQIADLKPDQSVEAKSWGGEGEAKYSKNNYFTIGNFSWDSLTVWVDKLSGPSTQGKFGPNLFEDKIIEIDFDNSLMVIHYSLPGPILEDGYQKFKLTFDRSSMFINGDLEIGEHSYSNTFMIHSGYGGTILLDDKFAVKHAIGDKLETISESELRDSFGNVLKTKKAVLPGLTIGGVEFPNIPIGFFEGAIGRQKMSVMGSEVLKRFNIFLDLRHSAIYLKPNKLMSLPF